eukprot:7652533-Pyramimonas_sp.AAC.1
MDLPRASQLKSGSSGVSTLSAKLLARESRARLMALDGVVDLLRRVIPIHAALPGCGRADPGGEVLDWVKAGVQGQGLLPDSSET